MILSQIETNLQNSDFQYRLKAISALRNYPSDVAVPVLTRHIRDREFLVRTFVARELGLKQISESFVALLEMMKFDDTPNVRAEAANSLSLFGKISASHLVQTFFADDHWLVRRSILAALLDMEFLPEIFEVCTYALEGRDKTILEAAIDTLGELFISHNSKDALSQLLKLKDSESEWIRIKVENILKNVDSSNDT